MYYNFVRIHQTLRVTPAMAAGVTDRLWTVMDIVRLVIGKEKEDRADATFGPHWVTIRLDGTKTY